MFIVWGSKWKYKVKENGLQVNKMCPECENRSDFCEVIPTKYFTFFWTPLFETKTQKPLLECPYCHERYYIQTQDYLNATQKISDLNIQKKVGRATGNHTIFKCLQCGQKLRIPIKKELLKITCPSCKSVFHFQNGKKI